MPTLLSRQLIERDYPICAERGWLPVGFTRDELQDIWAEARSFHLSKEVSTQQRKVSARSDQEVQFLGHKAEYAIAAILGIDVDRTVRGRGDDGHDLRAAGRTIQVKFTEHSAREPFLSFFPGELQSDVAALAVATPGAELMMGPCAVVGWIERRRFVEIKQRRSWGYGDREVVSWTDLRQFRVASEILGRVA